MNLKAASVLAVALVIAACGREQTNSDGNGPGAADGVGGREDPPTAPADMRQPAAGEAGSSATTTGEAEGSATTPPPQQ
jgi:hypothetical protein